MDQVQLIIDIEEQTELNFASRIWEHKKEVRLPFPWGRCDFFFVGIPSILSVRDAWSQEWGHATHGCWKRVLHKV